MLAGSVGLAAGAATSLPFLVPRYDQVRRPSRSRVAILRADEYSERLERDLMSGLRLFRPQSPWKVSSAEAESRGLPAGSRYQHPSPSSHCRRGMLPAAWCSLPSSWLKARDTNATPNWYFLKVGSETYSMNSAFLSLT